VDLDPVNSLVHLYEDGAFSRRELITRLTKYTGSAAAAAAIVESAGLAEAQTASCPAGIQVSEQDPAVISQLLTIHGEGGPLFIYQSLPADYARAPRPAVLVVHENRGLTDHIRDVTRRVAKAGFVAVAVDLLSRQGGTQTITDPEAALQAYNRTQQQQRTEDMASALLTIRDQPYVVRDKLAAVGFCAGGGNVFDLAVNTNLLNTAVVFYGPIPAQEALANLQAPLLGIFGQQDRFVNPRLPVLLTALTSGNKTYALHVYENAGHAFHNDTATSYNPAAACDAWAKTVAFLGRHLNNAGT
jgi:carboxymethylenebutenolidase